MIYEDEIKEVIKAAVSAVPTSVRALGGTATPKFDVRTSNGRFVLRIRPAEFSDENLIRFDHEVLWRLHRVGLPVPYPHKRPDGTSWFVSGRHVWEVLSWVEGEPFDINDLQAIYNLGRFLAQFHATLRDNIPFGKAGWRREDHPDLMVEYLRQLGTLCSGSAEENEITRIGNQIDLVKETLDGGLYEKLPEAIIHGDIHPGNLRFRDSHVSAVYDFDYISLQARARDVSDGLMFFAARRPSIMNPDDIYSLTQPFECDFERSRVFLDGYQQIIKLTDLEWSALPLLIRSRWLQIRLRGSRKVKKEQKILFVLDRFFELIEWLDERGADFFHRLRTVL
ncbi:MAG: phosphotransferase [Sedimentisphaerales bacterium]|nr:phosphotransferase [Sedimentisphaerales bacterium]